MSINYWFSMVRSLATEPQKAWESIYSSEESFGFHLRNYLQIWMSFIAVAALFRYSSGGVLFAIGNSFMFVAVDVMVVFVGAKVLHSFASGQKVWVSEGDLRRLLVYAGSGVYAGQLLSNLLAVSWPNILGAYSLYLFWLGFDYLGVLSAEKKGGFVAVAAMLLGATLLLSFILLNQLISFVVF